MAEKQRNIILQTIDAFFRVVLGYLKAQMIFFLVNVVLISVFLWIFGVRLPVLIALGISLLDLLPVAGSGLVFIPWSIVCFASQNSALGLRLALLYIGLVVLRQILEPIVTGKQVGLSPLMTLAASLLGLLVFDGVGVIIGPIIAAVFSSVYRLRTQTKPPPKS